MGLGLRVRVGEGVEGRQTADVLDDDDEGLRVDAVSSSTRSKPPPYTYPDMHNNKNRRREEARGRREGGERETRGRREGGEGGILTQLNEEGECVPIQASVQQA